MWFGMLLSAADCRLDVGWIGFGGEGCYLWEGLAEMLHSAAPGMEQGIKARSVGRRWWTSGRGVALKKCTR